MKALNRWVKIKMGYVKWKGTSRRKRWIIGRKVGFIGEKRDETIRRPRKLGFG